MKIKRMLLLGCFLVAAAGAAALAMLSVEGKDTAPDVSDPRQKAPVVKLAVANPVESRERGFTGFIAARVESNLGFRVPGMITERLVDAGQDVKSGQPLLRIDDTDLRLALAAKQKAVEAARATVSQLEPDERRHAKLLDNGWISEQRHEQVKAALDTARAQLAMAEADARLAENETTYAVLIADTDGTVIETLGEPGQVVSAGQPVVRIARAGPREAVVTLPETVRPSIGSPARASIYGDGDNIYEANLRQLSDAADPQTRTYEARYVLDGAAASAPLGATVTLRLTTGLSDPEVQVPIGAVLDDGTKTGVWLVDTATSTVHFWPVTLVRLSSETAVVSGLNPGEPVVSLGAHLLEEGARIRVSPGNGSVR